MTQYGYLGTLDPFLSRTLLIVYPVVYIYLHSPKKLLENLKANEDEVSAIFHLPLENILQAYSIKSPPGTLDGLVHSKRDLKWIHGTPYRWHSFSSPSLPSPLTGLTADILISLVILAYNVVTPGFGPVKAPAQPDWETLIQWALTGEGGGEHDEHSIVHKS